MLHKYFDFTKLGGFPLTQEILDFMQNTTESLADVIISIVGNNTIVSGCNKVVGQGNIMKMSSGWVVYDNELLPVVTSTWSNRLSLVEENETLTFGDGVSKEVQFSKYLISDP